MDKILEDFKNFDWGNMSDSVDIVDHIKHDKILKLIKFLESEKILVLVNHRNIKFDLLVKRGFKEFSEFLFLFGVEKVSIFMQFGDPFFQLLQKNFQKVFGIYK